MAQCNNCNGYKTVFSFCGEMWPANFVITLVVFLNMTLKEDNLCLFVLGMVTILTWCYKWIAFIIV